MVDYFLGLASYKSANLNKSKVLGTAVDSLTIERDTATIVIEWLPQWAREAREACMRNARVTFGKGLGDV